MFWAGLQKFANRPSTTNGSESDMPMVGLGPGVAEMISDFIGTRNANQVRSHAQKHFIRKWKEGK